MNARVFYPPLRAKKSCAKNLARLHRQLRLPPSARGYRRQSDAFQAAHRQLRPRQRNRAARRLRPHEAPTLQSFRTNRHNRVAVVPQNLNPIPDRLSVRETQTRAPKNGFCSSLLSTSALSPVNPRRKSVTPAAKNPNLRVFVGGPIIPVGTPATRAPTLDRRCLRSAPAPAAGRCGIVPGCGFWKSADMRSTGGGVGTLSLTRTGSNFIVRLALPKSSPAW